MDDALGTVGGELTLQVSAFFDARSKRMEITSLESRTPIERRPWGVKWGPQVVTSVLHHELTHMASLSVLGRDYARIGRAWLEFIAYSVEFQLMPQDLMQKILKGYALAKPFASPYEVNPIALAMDPDLFGLRAHLTTQANGGLAFVRRILADEVSFSRADILWLP